MSALVWIDLETTGLDPARDKILEVGMVATDRNLQPLTARNESVLAVPSPLSFTIMPHDGLDVSKWNPSVAAMHSENGLIADIVTSGIKLDGAGGARDHVNRWLRQLATSQGGSLTSANKWREDSEHLAFIMAGSTIGFDKAFFERVFSTDLFHYRTIDVSTVKELVRGWFGEDAVWPKPAAKSHRAIEDIQDSMDELRYYRANAFRTVFCG